MQSGPKSELWPRRPSVVAHARKHTHARTLIHLYHMKIFPEGLANEEGLGVDYCSA